jgi:hypothetical protein
MGAAPAVPTQPAADAAISNPPWGVAAPTNTATTELVDASF